MIALAVGLGVLGLCALRRARRRCYGADYGWHGPWAAYGPCRVCGGACGDDAYRDHDEEGEHGEHGADDAHGERGWQGDRRGPHGWHCGPHGRRFQRGWMRRGRRGRRWMLHAALSRIDATPAQERVIVGELDRLTERVRGARGGLREGTTDLAAAVRGPVLDDAALGAVLGRVDGVTAEVRAAAIEALRNIHAVLDDKQRAQVAELIERRAGRGGGGGGAGWFRMGPYR